MSRADEAAARAICFQINIAEHLDHDVFLLSLGKFRIPHRKPDEECPSAALSKNWKLSISLGRKSLESC
jgi:hypothetical protein